jgi:hypothetical protein
VFSGHQPAIPQPKGLPTLNLKMRRVERERIWHEGFDAARSPGARCPYPAASKQAQIWERGWAEGVMRRYGAPHHSEPAAVGWRRLIKMALGQNR